MYTDILWLAKFANSPTCYIQGRIQGGGLGGFHPPPPLTPLKENYKLI